MTEDKHHRIVVNGSCLTDSTCKGVTDVGKFALFSSVYTSLLFRYMAQAQAVRDCKTVGDDEPPNVLDIGCNNGAALRLYASDNFQSISRRYIRYHGVDLYEPAIAEARLNIPKRSCVVSAAFDVMDLSEPWDFDSNQFDVLWYTEVIEHLPRDKAFHSLQEAHRVAKPGARMLMCTPAPFYYGELVWPESHDHEFTRELMRTMIMGSGWKLVDEYGVNTNWRSARGRLKEADPALFEMYQKLRTRLSPPVAQAVMQALAPDICDDLMYVCEKEAK